MPTDPQLLTDGQRRLVGFAAALLALMASAGLLGLAFWVLAWAVGRFSGVLWPLALAGIVALILRPAVDLLEDRLHLRRLAAVIVLYGLFLVAAVGVALLVVPPLVQQVLDFVSYLPSFWQRVATSMPPGRALKSPWDWGVVTGPQQESPI